VPREFLLYATRFRFQHSLHPPKCKPESPSDQPIGKMNAQDYQNNSRNRNPPTVPSAISQQEQECNRKQHANEASYLTDVWSSCPDSYHRTRIRRAHCAQHLQPVSADWAI
jgi:hypothetical protein